jgi:pimeloyl-ACP methyl ester carboxylesterase
MPRTKVNGLTIGFDIIGDGARPWVLTPGGRFARDVAGLPPLADAIAGGGDNRVLVWDRPNCGESDVCFEGDNESQMQAEHLAGLLQQLDMAPAVVAAGSAGARVSLLAVLDDPGIAQALALWWISGRPMELFLLAYLYEVPQIKAAWEDGMNAVAALPDWSEQVAKNLGNRQRILDQEPAAFIATMERWMMAFVPKPDEYVPGLPNKRLGDITVPSLVINSETSDANHPRSVSEGIASLLPNCRLAEPVWGDGREWAKRSRSFRAGDAASVFEGWPALAPQLLEWADEVLGPTPNRTQE